MTDDQICAVQIGRPLRAAAKVVHRCELNLPTVLEVPPFLDHGEPFPTRYWLSCPLAVRRIARLEAAGGVRQMEARLKEDEGFRIQLEQSHERYREQRDALVSEDAVYKPSGGIGGTKMGVKCLHAHFADWLAGNDNPVGNEVRLRVLPLNCAKPCVVSERNGAGIRNADWQEPELKLSPSE